jgi:serine/threonine-protein kinase Chk2
MTHQDSTTTEAYDHSKDGTATPPSQHDVIPSSQYMSPKKSIGHGLNRLSNKFSQNSPPQETQTQAFSQFLPPLALEYEIEDEEGEGVWGYMVPTDSKGGDALVLKSRSACPAPAMPDKNAGKKVPKNEHKREEEKYEKTKITGLASSGYLFGRHPECDRMIGSPTVSNRHCLLFPENTSGTTTAVLEDLSGNGTYVNDQLVGRNKRRELHDGDEISILDEARYCFRYPRNRDTNGFRQQYSMQNSLGKGHFATVYLCVEKCTGMRYAVKKFEKRSGPGERSKVEGLQQEIAVLMGVSHPSLLCLKDTFDEEDGVYLVLELAPEGELFNYIVMKQKLSESEARKVFVQLFQAVKYLVRLSIPISIDRANTSPA